MRPIASRPFLRMFGSAGRLGAAVLMTVAPTAAAGEGHAQVEEQPAEADAWAATAGLSFTTTSGNQDLTVFTTGFGLEHRQVELFELTLNLRARYGSSDGETDVENYHGDMKLDLDPSSDWSPFLYTTAERDPTRRLDARLNSGAGGTYKLRRDDGRGRASVSLAVLHSYEAIQREPSDPAPASPHSARWSFQLDGRQDIREDVSINHKTSFEPVYDDFADHLLSLRTTFKVVVTSRLALSLSHQYDRDSTPASDGIETDDQLVQAGILVEL